MKKFLGFVGAIFISTFAIAHTINWHVGDQTISSTTCDSGDNINPPSAPAKYGYHVKGWNPYVQLEYIESTGTQWIDTGLKPNNNWRMVLAYKENTGVYGNVFGARNGYGNAAFVIGYMSSQSMVRLDYGSQVYPALPVSDWWDNKILVDFNKNVWTMVNTGTSQTYTKTFAPETFQTNYNMILFGLNNSGTEGSSYSIIYYCKIYDNDVLVRDFIPVLASNNTPCMYDKVTQQFYYNQGTGDFIAGPVLQE